MKSKPRESKIDYNFPRRRGARTLDLGKDMVSIVFRVSRVERGKAGEGKADNKSLSS